MTDVKELKKWGFIPQRQEGFFCLRVKVVGGTVPAGAMRAMADLAEKFGAGKLHLTSRQSVEIPFIKLENIDSFRRGLSEAGLAPANLGPGIRTISDCQGSELCRSGLINSQEKARLLQKMADELTLKLPHKLKIGITGCHNNCLKAEEHDIGLKGAFFPTLSSPEKCNHCGICQQVCPSGAITTSETNLQYAADKCSHCGRCYNKCPEKCWTGREGVHLYLGGLFGNTVQSGRLVVPTITDDETLLAVIKKVLSYFEANGRPGERLGRLITRLGWEACASLLRS